MTPYDYAEAARKLAWKRATMTEAVRHAQGREPLDPDVASAFLMLDGDDSEAGVVLFADGTGIACASDWSGPYSEVTPDIDGNPPRWYIGAPRHD